MKRACIPLLGFLLCSCTVHRAGGEDADSKRPPARMPERLPFLDREDPLVKRMSATMDDRANYNELREIMRAEGLRVCEEGESGPPWKEDCNTCWCDRGHRACTKARCQPPWVRRQFEETAREKAKLRKEQREMHRAAGRRVCEEGEDGTQWREDCNRCWCSWGVRVCTENVCEKSDRSKRGKASPNQAKP